MLLCNVLAKRQKWSLWLAKGFLKSHTSLLFSIDICTLKVPVDRTQQFNTAAGFFQRKGSTMLAVLAMTFWQKLGNDIGMMVFAALAMIGGVFTLISMIFGHGDHDVGHDFSAGDHDFSAGDQDDSAGSNFFSVRNIMLFMTGFGGIGMLAKYKGADFIESSFWGAFSGLIMALIGYLIYRALYKSQASSHIDNSMLRGSIAQVEEPIVQNGVGIIVAGGEINHIVRLRARTKEGTPVPSGRQVRILEVSGTEALAEAQQ
ncbi:MAG: hypothetical protein WC465_04205 [Patescibacteria group bacterium]